MIHRPATLRGMPRLYRLLLGVAVLTSACHDTRLVPITDLGGGMRPFSELRGVALGMTAEDLKRARPLALPAPGTGFQELLGDRTITYVIGGTPEHGPPAGDRRLMEVAAAQASASDSETMVVWREALIGVARRVGEPTRCTTYDNGITRGYEAGWRTGDLELMLAAYNTPRSSAREASSDPPTAVIARARFPERRSWWYSLLIPTDASHSPRQEVPCSTFIRQP